MIEVYDKRKPKEEDYEDYDAYEEALEEWAEDATDDIPISEGVYKDIMDHYEYSCISSKTFVLGDEQYSAVVLHFQDGEYPDNMNTRILLVREG